MPGLYTCTCAPQMNCTKCRKNSAMPTEAMSRMAGVVRRSGLYSRRSMSTAAIGVMTREASAAAHMGQPAVALKNSAR